MRFFKLPDLGEGIPEAEIVEWHIREGDTVHEDQVIVSMETAKAVVEVPAPCSGVVVRQFGQPGDLIHTGEPLVEFEGEDADSGTVVGKITKASSSDESEEDHFFVGASPSTTRMQQLARPAVNQLTRNFFGTMPNITIENGEKLKGVRREMARSMNLSGHEVVSATLFADADLHHWSDQEDLTVRTVLALIAGCREEPALNTWFDGRKEQRQLMDDINIGLAVDSPHGLLVPVLRHAHSLTPERIREEIEQLKSGVLERKLPPDAFQGATISVSNFGALGTGRYATPVVVPPAVAILGIGSVCDQVVAIEGQPAVRRIMSLSLSFDHRAVTGGEASRFLKAVVHSLEQKKG